MPRRPHWKGMGTQKFPRTVIYKHQKVLKCLGQQLKFNSVLILKTMRPNARNFCVLPLAFFPLGPALETATERLQQQGN